MQPAPAAMPTQQITGLRLRDASDRRSQSIFAGTRNKAVRGDRPRSQWPMLISTLAVLTALVVVPFLVLRPREVPYVLRSFTAASVTRATIEETVSSPGLILPNDIADVAARTSGLLERITVAEGDFVAIGSVLGQVVSADLENSERDARANLNSLQADLDETRFSTIQTARDAQTKVENLNDAVSEAKKSAGRINVLYQAGGETRLNLEAANAKVVALTRDARAAQNALSDAIEAGRIKVQSRERSFESAKTDLARAVRNLERTVIRASISGRVVSVAARVGQDVQAGAKLLTIADVSSLRVEGNVNASVATRLKVGQPTRITVGDRSYPGKVSKIAAQAATGANGATVKTEVRFLASAAGLGDLRPNSSASLEITVGRKENVPTLPRAEFLSTGGERLAYVIDDPKLANSKATRRDVTFGASSAERIEVTSGLSVGERVITSSVEAFKDKAEIEVSSGGELK